MSATQINRIVVKWNGSHKRIHKCPFNVQDGIDTCCFILGDNEKIVMCKYNTTKKLPKACPLWQHVLVEVE